MAVPPGGGKADAGVVPIPPFSQSHASAIATSPAGTTQTRSGPPRLGTQRRRHLRHSFTSVAQVKIQGTRPLKAANPRRFKATWRTASLRL